jgi:hypothetical protein
MIPIPKYMYLELKKEKHQMRKASEREDAAIRIQHAVVAWLYAPPDRQSGFRGGPMYRKLSQPYYAVPDSWEEYADSLLGLRL